jgi:hypothetical protein
MTDLRTAAQQALEALETVFMPHHPAVIALRAALAEEALQRLSDANQEIESMIVDEGCFERGCACHDSRESPGVVVVKQPEREPLAWLESPYGSIRMNTAMRFQFPPQSLKWKIPLYTHLPRRETEQEPVAVFDEQQGSPVLLASAPMLSDGQPLYTHPPRREWRSLSEDELTALGIIHSRYQEESLETGGWFDFARAVEAALKEKNHE